MISVQTHSRLKIKCFISQIKSVFCSSGDLLIIMAQIVASVQMVLEEKFVYKHDVHPLRAVGTEGKAILCLCMQHISQKKKAFTSLTLTNAHIAKY